MKTVLGSNYVVEQLSSSLFFSILTFDFDSILGLFLTFWDPNRLFFGFNEGFKNGFGVHSCSFTTFIFYDYLTSDI